jgi:hypothetical protein
VFGEGDKTVDKAIKTYLDRASEIIGHRTPGEIAHDDAVVEALNLGRTIEEALTIAGRKYPDEAIKWDDGNIDDIASHYDYLKEHARIMEMLGKRGER